jgi:hypothetical protein
MFYSFDGLIKEFLMRVPLRQLELVSSSSVNQARWQGKQISAQSMQGNRVPLLGQTQAFEPVDQIVSQQNQMKMNLIGQEAVGRDTSQGEAFFEFPDIQFASGSWLVEMPYSFRAQCKIGNKCMIKIIFEFPERKLIFLFFGFGLGTANYNEAMRFFPIVRLVGKPGRLPTAFPEGMIAKDLNLFLNRLGHFGYDYVTSPFLVERLDKLVVEESGVGADTDTVEIFGNFPSAGRPKLLGSSCWMGISWTQDALPGIPTVSLEANQGVVTGATGLLGIVTNLCAFDIPTKDLQNRRIQVEDETADLMRQSPDFSAQEVVYADNSLRLGKAYPFQESSQGGRLRKLFQPQQFLEATIVLDYLSIENTPHPRNHGINQTLQEFDWMIDTASALPAGMPLQCPFEVQLSTKSLKNNHSSKVSQPWILEGKCDFSDAFSHYTETILLVMFPRQANYRNHYKVSSSIMPTFLSLFCGDSPFFQDNFSIFPSPRIAPAAFPPALFFWLAALRRRRKIKSAP